MMPEYLLLDSPIYPHRWIGKEPFHRHLRWRFGRPLEGEVPKPLEFALKPFSPHSSDHGPLIPPYFSRSIPLFQDDFLKACQDGGADNLDAYAAVLVDPDNGQRHTNWKAVNIIGMLAAADMARSKATVHPGGPPLIDVDFDSLVLDPNKTHGMLVFRLAESNNAVLFHRELVEHLANAGFKDSVRFLDPKDCAL